VTLRRRLDRKTRIAISAAATLLIASPLLGLRNLVSSVQEGGRPVAVGQPVDDGLLQLKNGATVFLQDGALARKFAAWLELDNSANSAFEIADGNFALNTAEPTSDGRARIAQVAQVLNADPQLHAQIVVAKGAAAVASSEGLTRSRAARIQSELLAQHVAASRIAPLMKSVSAASVEHVTKDLGRRSGLAVVLSR
jgi:outer membrane protein OmpA-like peptidoglycan-associated protein